MNNSKQNMVAVWFAWHFFYMPRFLFSVFENYLLFILDYFSIPLLLATLFSPWRKYRWNYPKSFDIGQYLGNFIFNTFSRIIGLACRIILIFLGIIAVILVLGIGIAGILFWISLPFISLILLFTLFYV